MVDPDGTLDALSNLGLTSPLTDPNLNPGPPHGLPVLQPGPGTSPSGPLPPSRPVVLPTNPGGPSDQTEGAKWAPGSSETCTWHQKRVKQNTSVRFLVCQKSWKQIVSSVLDQQGVALYLSLLPKSIQPKLSPAWKSKRMQSAKIYCRPSVLVCSFFSASTKRWQIKHLGSESVCVLSDWSVRVL